MQVDFKGVNAHIVKGIAVEEGLALHVVGGRNAY
jgi:hypothetical protein